MYQFFFALMLALLAGRAVADCAPLRFAYTDKEVLPYYVGAGAEVAEPPGAAVELMREAAVKAGCPLSLQRLPTGRLLASLDAGTIDAMLTYAPEVVGAGPNVVYPLDRAGRPDPARGMRLYTMVFVRAADGLPRGGAPAELLRGRVVGLSQGAQHIKLLRGLGLTVDDGAANPALNFEKLKLGRIDAFAIALGAPDEMDALLAVRYGGRFVRLDKPLLRPGSWLVFNKSYYEGNRRQAEALWQWMGANSSARIGALSRKYTGRLSRMPDPPLVTTD